MPPKGSKTLAKRPSSSSNPPRSTRARRTTDPPPPPLPWPFRNREQEERYTVLAKRTLVPCRYIDEYTIEHIGIKDRVHRALASIGWTNFALLKHHTYREITLEFLSSFISDLNHFEERDKPCIRFRCMGIEHHLSLLDFNALLSIPHEGERWVPPNFSNLAAWHSLGGHGVYTAGLAKSTQINDPALRYLHRFMSHTVFGRGESVGAVRKNELFFLWALRNSLKVNTGVWIVKHFAHVAQSSSGSICVGGLITAIALMYGFGAEMEACTRVHGNEVLNLDSLVKMKMCAYLGNGVYRLLDSDGQAIQGDEEEDEQFHEALSESASSDDEPVPPQPAPQPSTEAGPSTSTLDRVLDRLDRMELDVAGISSIVNSHTQALARIEASLKRIEDRSG